MTKKEPTFYRTIIDSPYWKLWRKEQERRLDEGELESVFDIVESEECGWISPKHFKAFMEFFMFLVKKDVINLINK